MVFDRSNTPVDPGVLERVMDRLSHRGPDGKDTRLAGPLGMGFWHFWVTPEEAGERQPLELPGLPYWLVFDGRLDNRAEVASRLMIEPAEARCHSDAALVLRAFARWGEACFAGFTGEFALVLYDLVNHALVLARDPLGHRGLSYAIRGNRVIVASEPWAVAAGLEGGVALSERAIAYHFSVNEPEDGQTMFAGIYELLPARWLKITPTGEQQQRYWEPQVNPHNPKRSDADYADEFRALLEESVRCRLRSITPPGVMMSGGLDSTSVACLAARLLAPQPLTTVSYVFDRFPDCDERDYINAVRDQYGTRSIQIPVDNEWPFKDSQSWPVDPSWPPGNPYRWILERTYAGAREAGLKVMLTGTYGDDLYTGTEHLLTDALGDGKVGRASRELYSLVRNYGLARTVRSEVTRKVARQLLPARNTRTRRPARPSSPDWMTPFGASLLDLQPGSPGLERHSALLDLSNAASSSREFHTTNRYGLELRDPYYDRRLVEFVLSLPAYLFYSMGNSKSILRLAMAGILPEKIRTRRGYTSFLSFYDYGLKQESVAIQARLGLPHAAWKKYVQPDFVRAQWEGKLIPATDGSKAVAASLCFLFDLWYNSIKLDVVVSEELMSQKKPVSQAVGAVKCYRVPRLEKLGDLRTVTLGGSRGMGESNPGNQPRRRRLNEPIIVPQPQPQPTDSNQ